MAGALCESEGGGTGGRAPGGGGGAEGGFGTEGAVRRDVSPSDM